jgi:hypothetical protein
MLRAGFQKNRTASSCALSLTPSIILTNGVSTWKRPGGSAANPPEAIGSIVHSLAGAATAFPRGNEPKTPTKVFGFSARTIPLKKAKNHIQGCFQWYYPSPAQPASEAGGGDCRSSRLP